MRLFLVRHPQPLVAPGVCYGSSDVVVAPDELARSASRLAPILPSDAPLFCSPLQRCAGLADRLADRLANPPPRFDARLAEIDFGSWEMLNWCDIARSEIDAWAADPIDYHPGGGESVLQVAARVRDFQQDLQRQQFAQAIVLCHAGTVRLLCAMQHGGSLRDCARRAASAPHSIAYGTMLTIEI